MTQIVEALFVMYIKCTVVFDTVLLKSTIIKILLKWVGCLLV
jgi:hypothetical protein